MGSMHWITRLRCDSLLYHFHAVGSSVENERTVTVRPRALLELQPALSASSPPIHFETFAEYFKQGF